MNKVFEIEGKFEEYHYKKRLNRFVVETEEGKICHLHDPGRLNELLIPGYPVYAIKKNTGLNCEIIYVKIEDELVLINSKYHNKIAENLILGGFLGKNFKIKKREVPYMGKRLDFLLNLEGIDYYLEVKGCTLVEGKIAKFPDAPTSRGREHVEDLIKIKEGGLGAGILFLVFRDANYFMPNYSADPKFSEILKMAFKKGVEIFPYKLFFNGRELYEIGMLEIKIDGPAGI
ncbi:MAG: DNA/RNA nuclease SfsA [Thermoplasmata archaeon]|nr:DNA/RNA nuclease SfsA [Euryarchaeota archaeon]MVT35857.1 DNA/RNA nuclease SfsA [Euryarchaeota archaeon]